MLVSFTVVQDDYSFKVPINYLQLTDEIEYRDFNCEINVLGLRNLESFGLMPVKKPFIKFNLRSLLPPEKAQAVTNVKTQPNAPGSSPNINTMISFSIDLPVNPLFCPKLQCDVFDYVYKGLVQPLLGTFTLPIGDIMHQIRQDREAELEESEQVLFELEALLRDMDAGGLAPEKNLALDQRVAVLNKLASAQDSSRLLTEAGDKDALIGGGPTDPGKEEEAKLEEALHDAGGDNAVQ